jgi:alkylhydroperoxidase family enzyme
MSARESWTSRGAHRAGRDEAARGSAPAVPGPVSAACRCDRCGAQAYVRVVLHSRQDLMFCAHHYRQHAPALAGVAVAIHERPSGSHEVTGPAHGTEGSA